MPEKRITELEELQTPHIDDVVAVVDVSDVTQAPSGSTKKIKLKTLLGQEPAADSIVDTFSMLSSGWNVACGAAAVENGLLKATVLGHGYPWTFPELPDLSFETDPLQMPIYGWYGSGVDIAHYPEERTGGSGVRCMSMTPNTSDPGIRYAHYFAGRSVVGITWGLSAWVRKTTTDSYPVELMLRQGNNDPVELDSTLSEAWTYLEGSQRSVDNLNPYVRIGFPDNTPIGVGALVDDVYLYWDQALLLRDDWYSEDVQIEVETANPPSGVSGARGIVLRHVDEKNYVLVYWDPTTTSIEVVDVIDGIWYPHWNDTAVIGTVSWTADGYDRLRVRLAGESLRIDIKMSGDTEWTNDYYACLVQNNHSTKHGLALFDTAYPAFREVTFSQYHNDAQPTIFQQVISWFQPATATNERFRCVMPYDCEIRHASFVGNNVSDGRVKIGHPSDDDEYLTYTDVGDSGVPVAVEENPLVGWRYDNFPVVRAGSTLIVTLDPDGPGGSLVDKATAVLTFKTIP